MTTTLTVTSGQTSFTAQGYTIVPNPGTAVPDNVAPAIISAATGAGVVLSSSAGTGSVIVPARRFFNSTTGAPTSGPWQLGDEVVDANGFEWECTAAGSPGAWQAAQSGSYAPVASTLADVAGIVTSAGALTVGRHNPVNASGGAKAMTLANASAGGQITTVEKTDSSTNAVTVTLNLRGTPGGTLTLVWQNEAIELLSKADGSWWPVAGHKTKAALDAAYVPIASLTSINVRNYGAVGNGVADDTAAVQSAVAATQAAAAGGAKGVTLLFPPGSYVVTSSVLLKDIDKLSVLMTGATIRSSAGGHILQLLRCTNFEVTGGLLVNTATGARQSAYDGVNLLYCTDGRVSNVNVGYVRSIGIRPQASARVTVTGCMVSGTVADGIGCYSGLLQSGTTGSMTSGSNVLTVNDTTFLPLSGLMVGSVVTVPGAGAAGATLVSTITSFTNATTAVLAANASTTVSSKTITVGRGCDQISFVGNQVTGSGDDCFSCVTYNNLAGTAAPLVSKNITFAGNTAKNSGARGIVVVGADGFSVVGNTVDTTQSPGILVNYDVTAQSTGSNDGVVAENSIRNFGLGSSSRQGILISSNSTSYPVSNVVVANNTLRGGASSYVEVGSASAGTSDVTVTGNRGKGGGTAVGFGFEIHNVVNVDVVGNTISGSYLSAVNMEGNTGSVRYQNNTIAATNIGAQGYPAAIISDPGTVIIGNVNLDTGPSQHMDASGATNATIANNSGSGSIVFPGSFAGPDTSYKSIVSLPTSATTGAAGAPPAQVAAYEQVVINGTRYKRPLYLN